MHTNSLPPTDRDEFVAENSINPVNPVNPVKTFPCNETIRQKLRELRASSGVYSNNEIGKKLGYSSATISQYLSDDGCKYNGNIKGLEKLAADMLRAIERRRTSGVSTSPAKVATKMLETFEHIRKTNDCGAIIAASGRGKTRGVEIICETHPLTILIECTEWNSSKEEIRQAIIAGCALDGWERNTPQFPWLVDKMAGRDRPFLFDDAHKLSRPALSLVITFHEKTGSPVCLLGTPELVKKLEGDAQRLSRAGICYTEKLAATDPNLLVHMVRSIAKDINGELDELLELCGIVASHQGHFRAVHKQLKLAAEFRHAKGNEDMTWCSAFRQAHELLIRPYKLP